MNKGLILTAGVFIALNLAWIILFMETTRDYRQKIEESKERIRNQDRDLRHGREVLAGLLESDGYPLSQGLRLLTAEGSSSGIMEILQGEPRLVLYIADDQCDSCVEQILFGIMRFASEIELSNLVVFYATRELSSSKWKKYALILPETRFYRIMTENLKIPLARSGVPFLFICDSSLNIQAPMLIFPGDYESIATYLKLIHLKSTLKIHEE